MKFCLLLVAILFSNILHFNGFAQDFNSDIKQALTYKNAGKYAEAAELFAKWVPIAKKESGENDTSVYLKLVNIAIACYYRAGLYDQAEPLMTEAARIKKATLGEKCPEYALSLSDLATLYQMMGRYKEAEILMKNALQIYRVTLGRNHPFYATCLNNGAQLFQTIGRYEEAEQMMKEALQIYIASFGKNHTEYATAFYNLGLLYYYTGRYEEAEPMMKESMQFAKETYGVNHPDYSVRISNLALLYQMTGRYEEAEPMNKEAIRIAKESLGVDHPTYASQIMNLASLYQAMDRNEQAEPLMKEAMLINGKSLGLNNLSYGQDLNNLATLYQKMGRYKEAEPIMKEATRITKESLGADHPNYAVNILNLARIFEDMGQYVEAEQLMKEARQILKKSLGENHLFYTRCLNSLALLYLEMQQYAKAEPLLKEVMRIDKASLGMDHPDYGRDLHNLTICYMTMGSYELLAPLMKESYLFLQNNLQSNSSYLSEEELYNYQDKISFTREIYQSFNYQQTILGKKDGEFALEIELFQKGLLLNSIIETRKRILNSGDTSLINRFQTMMSFRKQAEKLYSIPTEQRYENPAILVEKATDLEKDLKLRSKEYNRSLEEAEITWKQVQNKLKSNETIVEFASFAYYNKHWTDSTIYCALILKKGMEYPVMVPLFEQRQLDSILLEGKVGANNLYASRGITSTYIPQLPNGRKLYNLIWKPLEQELKDVNTVYYSPSGSLHQIAFAALPIDSTTILCDTFNLIQLSSTRQLAITTWQTKPEQITSTALFGGIKYDLDGPEITKLQQSLPKNDLALSRGFTSDSTLRSNPYDSLPGTRKEVESIAGMLQANNIKTTLYTGVQGTEEAFKSLSNQKISVLHVATHGFFYPDIKEKPQDLDQLMITGEQKFRYVSNPLRRSGLILAGGNRTWKGEEPVAGLEDGILTAQEISEMNLQNTELVVLSACETGLGDIKGGEGVFGLQRAFKLAGVKTIIMSLWKVPDGSTAEMMQLFYSKWLGGMEKREAFRETQREMHKRYPKSPKDWAGFVMLD